MHRPSLEVLEFNKIKEMVAEQARTYPGKDKVRSLVPFKYKDQVQYKLKEAGQAAALIEELGRPPLLCPEDIPAILERANKEIVLQISEISKVERLIRSTGNSLAYFKDLKDLEEKFKSGDNLIIDGPLLKYAENLERQGELLNEINKIID